MSAGTATDPDPATTLRRLALALHASRALHAAAVLDLAGLLADGPRDSASLGPTTVAHLDGAHVHLGADLGHAGRPEEPGQRPTARPVPVRGLHGRAVGVIEDPPRRVLRVANVRCAVPTLDGEGSVRARANRPVCRPGRRW